MGLGLVLVLVGAVLGGSFAKLVKLQPLIGYILAGVVVGSIFPINSVEVSKLAELGSVLLLFSIGLTFSLTELGRNLKKIVTGSLSQIVAVSLILFFALSLLNFEFPASLILAMGFSLSSTAVVVKVLSSRGETETIHGKLMVGWLLVQDLAVVPMMIVLPVLANPGASGMWASLSISLLKALILVVVSVILGKHVAPYIIHQAAKLNSRELLVVTSVLLAVGMAYGVTLFGISATLGAFLAGLVISESQENHAVFAETRPLRDLFVALFFVTLGFSLNIGVVTSNLGLILGIFALVIIVKFLVMLFVVTLLGYRGKALLSSSLGLSEIGEFAFVIFAFAVSLGILSLEVASIGTAVALLTLLFTPIIFRFNIPIWRKLKFIKIFSTGEKNIEPESEFENHIIICGYGRVGSWVGKALESHNVPFVVIEYDWSVAKGLKESGTPFVYGDPSEPEVLDSAKLKSAKAVIVAIPDRLAQESLIAHIQTVSPDTKIISRVNLDEDWAKLKSLRVDKLVQPEFEAAREIVKTVLRSMGKDITEIRKTLKNLRLSHAKI